MFTSTQKSAQHSHVQARRAYWSSLVGTAIEYYDFIIYSAAAALVLNAVFFSDVPSGIGTIAAFATLSVGYFARPVGGIIFGHFGDRIGRKPLLILSLVIAGAATTVIGVLPTPNEIGVIAPILLVALRLIQGFAVGGEWAGSVLMSVEHAQSGRRGFAGAATSLGGASGQLAAFAVFAVATTLIPSDEFMEWGWRLPFLITGLLLVISLYIRLKVTETPSLSSAAVQTAEPVGTDPKVRSAVPLVEVAKAHRRGVALAIGAVLASFTVQAVALTLGIAYAVNEIGVSRSTMSTITTCAVAVELVVILGVSLLADRIGRRLLLIVGTSILALSGLVFFPLLNTDSLVLISVAFLLVVSLGTGATYAVTPTLIAEQFPASVRYTGASLTYQLTAAIGGGLGPVLGATFVEVDFLGTTAVAGLLLLTCVISIACTWKLSEKRARDLS